MKDSRGFLTMLAGGFVIALGVGLVATTSILVQLLGAIVIVGGAVTMFVGTRLLFREYPIRRRRPSRQHRQQGS
jgi:hypothetical protein